MRDAAYYRAWRRQHPEYRERERERSRSRSRTPEQRRAERERAKARKKRLERERAQSREYMRRKRAAMSEHEKNVEKIVKRHKMRVLNHIRSWRGETSSQTLKQRDLRAMKWMLEAESIVSRLMSRDNRTEVYDPLYEDAVSECLVMLMRHRKTKKEHRDRIVTDHIREYIRSERMYRWPLRELPPEL